QITVATARSILEQMRSLSREDFSPEAFPNFDWKFVERGDSWHKGDTRRSSDSEIELFSGSLIWNISNAIRKARWTFGMPRLFFRSRAQETFWQRLRNVCARSNSRLKIAFRVKPRESQ